MQTSNRLPKPPSTVASQLHLRTLIHRQSGPIRKTPHFDHKLNIIARKHTPGMACRRPGRADPGVGRIPRGGGGGGPRGGPPGRGAFPSNGARTGIAPAGGGPRGGPGRGSNPPLGGPLMLLLPPLPPLPPPLFPPPLPLPPPPPPGRGGLSPCPMADVGACMQSLFLACPLRASGIVIQMQM